MGSKRDEIRPYLGQLKGLQEQIPSLGQGDFYAFSNNELGIQFNYVVTDLASIMCEDLSQFHADAVFEPLLLLKAKVGRLIGYLEGKYFPETFMPISGASTNVHVNTTNTINLAITTLVKNELISALDKELETLKDDDPAKSTFEKIKEGIKESAGLEDVVRVVVGVAKGIFL